METISVQNIAFPSAGNEVFNRGEDILKNKLSNFYLIHSEANPEILFVLTGGSEFQAKQILKSTSSVIILAVNENNSYAAATEIKAYCNANKIDSILINLDTESDYYLKIENFIRLKNAINQMKGYRLGLLGNISEWLISSDIDKNILMEKMGIELIEIEWGDYNDFNDFDPNSEFLNHFAHKSTIDIIDSSKVYNLIKFVIEKNKLDAITVECFPLVRKNAVTACLALSRLNDESFPAGCEGDLTSITGMIFGKELTGTIPWMANLVSINKNTVFFAHCTIATNLIEDYKIMTHFETNSGNAVQGRFKDDVVTIFRFDKLLESAFVAEGKIINRPEKTDACRTQIEVELSENMIRFLKEKPLGNHHLVVPGNYGQLIKSFCKAKQIQIIE